MNSTCEIWKCYRRPAPPLRIAVSLEPISSSTFTRVAISIPMSYDDAIPGDAILYWPVFHLRTATLALCVDSDYTDDPFEALSIFAYLFQEPDILEDPEFGLRIASAYIERLVLHLGHLQGPSKASRLSLMYSTGMIVQRCVSGLLRAGVTVYTVWIIDSGDDWSVQIGMKRYLEEPENVVNRSDKYIGKDGG